MTGGVATIEAGAEFQIRFQARFAALLGPIATISFEDPCSQDCQADEDRCPEDMACYEAATQFCGSCLGGTPQMCACVDDEQMSLPDGTDCLYTEGDLSMFGDCRGGSCEAGFKSR